VPDYRVTIAGDSAIDLEFAHEISPETSTAIRMAAIRLTEDPIPGVTELIPTFCALMVQYDPAVILYDDLVSQLSGKLGCLGPAQLESKMVHVIPVCYGGEFGPDLPAVAAHAGLSEDEVVEIHCAHDYLIDMLGFLPGFAYLGGLDPRLHTPRLEKPRLRIEAGAVGIGGAQTGVYPLPSPGGWQIIGRTPLRPYDPARAVPILYAAGEYLRFEPISAEEYAMIEAQLASGTYVYRTMNEEV